jgi:hypothetical protein
MQDNTITLSVDPANDGNPENRVFTRFSEETNKSTYTGPSHSLAVPETLTLYRTLPKVSGLYLGTAKSAAKYTQPVTVLDAEGNSTTKAVIWQLSVSAPVGTPDATLIEGAQHIVGFADNDAVCQGLVRALSI